jgi:hypothetical protein
MVFQLSSSSFRYAIMTKTALPVDSREQRSAAFCLA